MILKNIKNDLNQALKAKDETQVSTLRFLLAEIHNREIQKQAAATDEDVVAAIRFQVKQHQEAIEAYRRGKRDDLVGKEVAELSILNKYLPHQMPLEELEKVVKEVISEVGAAGPKDFGKVMGAVMAKVKDQADGSAVADLVKKILGR